MSDANRHLALRYFDCINRGGWDALRALWHDDVEVIAVGARPRRGPDDAAALYPKLFAPWVTHHDEPTRIVVAGDVVTVEVTFTGETPDGRTLTFDAVDVIDVE